MPIPRSIAMTPEGELDLSRGFRLTSGLKEYTAQKLRQRLKFFLAEWFLDQRLGVPYFQKIFVENPDLPLLTTLYSRIVVGTPGVASVESLVLRFDRKTRILYVSFVAPLIKSPEKVVFVDVPFVLGFGP